MRRWYEGFVQLVVEDLGILCALAAPVLLGFGFERIRFMDSGILMMQLGFVSVGLLVVFFFLSLTVRKRGYGQTIPCLMIYGAFVASALMVFHLIFGSNRVFWVEHFGVIMGIGVTLAYGMVKCSEAVDARLHRPYRVERAYMA